MDNKKYIIRCSYSGVFYGEIAKREGQEVTIRNARQLWYWSGANSLMQLANEGVKKPQDCKFTVTVAELVVLDAIEILPCTAVAVANIEAVPEWK
ncbi:MAG: DUF6948 domain-containing protein [Candidatus Limivicinus sp.]